ncbi:MAG: thiamine pyrophosphate-dependent enzyme [Acidimicrobiia bacterium]|nr:thiamine pyrophosphate-dependent enzyme [Acidimicrobiia bacterium]
MSAIISITPLGSYRNDSPYPFCPGCGHKSILDHLNEALVELQVDPAKTVIVSDIGCSGLSDQYFITSAFHGLHGRSVTYATGIKLAQPDLTVIVVMGDGGTGIGGTHLINAARRNIGVTVLVFNNFNYGMTGGQHSATTPEGAMTITTPDGNLEQPLDICATVGINGAGYVWRGTNFDTDLTEKIGEAIQSDSFALLDIWELCTAYFVKSNQFSRRAIDATLEDLGFATGVLFRNERPEYSSALRTAGLPSRGKPVDAPQPIGAEWEASLARPFMIEMAGSAGGRVRSAVRIGAVAAIKSGLYAAQRDDYPVTVKTGHSLSKLLLADRPIDYAGPEDLDVMVVLSEDGYRKVRTRIAQLSEQAAVYVVPEFAEIETNARLQVIDPSVLPGRVGKGDLALVALAAVLNQTGIIPIEALRAAAAEGPFGEANLAAVEQGVGLGSI